MIADTAPTELDLVQAFAQSRQDILGLAAAGTGTVAEASRFLLGYLKAMSHQDWSDFDAHMPSALAWAALSPDLQVAVLGAITMRHLRNERWGDHALLVQRMSTLLRETTSPWAHGMIHRCAWLAAAHVHDISRAVAISTAAVEEFPAGSDLWLEFVYRDGQSRVDDGDVVGAEDRLRSLRQHASNLARCGLPLTMLQDAVDLALDQAERVLQRTDAPPPNPWHRGMALVQRGRYAELQRLIATLVPADGGPPSIDSIAGQLSLMAAFRQQRYREAKTILDRASAAAVPAQRLWILDGALTLALDQRRATAARAALSSLDPERSGGAYTFSWVQVHLLEGDLDRAQEAFARLIARSPQSMILRLVNEARGLSAVDMARLWTGLGKTVDTQDRPRTANAALAPDWTLVGDSPAMIEVRAWINQAAQVRTPVLISGETGTGKEIAARLLHLQGPAAREPFVALNCGAIGDSLAEAELFGHARGAFTGAVAAGPGLIAAAGSGTLFLDEINSLSLRLQAVLLRVLENGEYRPVGSTLQQRAGCRIIVASNQDLAAAVAAGTFRSDLRFRLERLVLHMPPLRDRPEDIPVLATHFLRRFSRDPSDRIDAATAAALMARPWPGNVRELHNDIERRVLFQAMSPPRRPATAATVRPETVARPATAATVRPAEPTARPAVRLPAAQVPGPPEARARRRRILALFDHSVEVFPADAMTETGAAASTVARDLAALVAAGLIRRDQRSGHARMNPFLRT